MQHTIELRIDYDIVGATIDAQYNSTLSLLYAELNYQVNPVGYTELRELNSDPFFSIATYHGNTHSSFICEIGYDPYEPDDNGNFILVGPCVDLKTCADYAINHIISIMSRIETTTIYIRGYISVMELGIQVSFPPYEYRTS